MPNMISKAMRRTLSSSVSITHGAVALLGLLLLPACTSYLTDGVITTTIGQESDAWTVEPAAKNVLFEMVKSTGRTTLATVPAPVSSISIGTEGQSGIASFEATAFDVDASVVMWGSSVPLEVYGFEDARIAIFMGRVAGLSRAPGDLVFARSHPRMVTLFHGYLMISGGDDESPNLDVYDMVKWLAAPQQKPLPTIPESWGVAGSKLLLIDHTGAVWEDMLTRVTSEVVVPAGVDFAAVAGGETISAPDDTQYIVGATRLTDEPTNQVIRVDPDGTLHLMKLGTPRLGASAAIVDDQLLVVGGSETGPGAELSNTTGIGFTPLDFPSDATVGAALVADSATSAVLAGGRDPETDEIAGFRTMDLSCSTNCAQVELGNVDFAFDHPRLFALREGQVVAVGEQPDSGETHVFTFDTGIGHALIEYALRTPRTKASAFMLPNGQVGVLGGHAMADETPATSVELFFPQP
jgi:hypothetical protein